MSDPAPQSSAIACAACRHEIDSSAKVCPYCGSDPRTGQKVVDTRALLQEIFKPRRLSASESVLEYARHRQGIVIAISSILLFLILAALHQFVTIRNQREVSAAPPVPLTEVTDVSNPQEETKARPLPDMNFQYEGRPQAMRTFIAEPGAVTPPEVVAAQQAKTQPQPATAAPAAPVPPPAATQAPAQTQ